MPQRRWPFSVASRSGRCVSSTAASSRSLEESMGAQIDAHAIAYHDALGRAEVAEAMLAELQAVFSGMAGAGASAEGASE